MTQPLRNRQAGTDVSQNALEQKVTGFIACQLLFHLILKPTGPPPAKSSAGFRSVDCALLLE